MTKLISKKYVEYRLQKIFNLQADINPHDAEFKSPSGPLRDYVNGVLFLRAVGADKGKHRISSKPARKLAKQKARCLSKDLGHVLQSAISIDQLVEKFEITPRSIGQIGVHARKWRGVSNKI